MDKIKFRQIAKSIKKSFDNWDFNRAIKLSDNETATRDYLIEPFFNILGYSKMDDYSHEFSLKMDKGKVKRVDMAITITGKAPLILIECKKATSNLTTANFNQLSEYYKFHKESKIGILTNGLIYKFYARSLDDNSILNKEPFLTFDLNDFNSNDLDNLTPFYRPTIIIKEILEDAEEQYFLEKFDNGLFETLNKPNNDFIKLVYNNMGGKRISEKISKKIFSLINSISLSETLDKIKLQESEESKSGVLTTREELKSFDIIKTILAMSSKIKNVDLDRIGYKDHKGFFNVIVDNSTRKSICHLKISEKIKSIDINGKDFLIDGISAKEITKYKSELVESAINKLYT